MFRKKSTWVILGLAAIGGVLVGLAGLPLDTRQAQANLPQPVPPEWAEVHALYWGADDTLAQAQTDLTALTDLHIQRADTWLEVETYAAKAGLDMLIFDKTTMHGLDPAWAAAQYRRGTAFMGLNVPHAVMGALLNDPTYTDPRSSFAQGAKALVEPFYNATFFRAIGDPKDIEALEAHGLLLATDDNVMEARAKLGLTNVIIGGGHSAQNLTEFSLAKALDELRGDLDRAYLVRPASP